MTHGTEFHPSPKRPRTRRRARRATQARALQTTLGTVPEMSTNGDESNDEEVVVSLLGGEHKDDMPERGVKTPRVTFGTELTNSPTKRGVGVRLSPIKLVRG